MQMRHKTCAKSGPYDLYHAYLVIHRAIQSIYVIYPSSEEFASEDFVNPSLLKHTYSLKLCELTYLRVY